MSLLRLPLLALPLFFAACSSMPANAGEEGLPDTKPAVEGGLDVAPVDDAPVSSAMLFFHVRSTTAPFAHADGFAGQTSRATKQGIRSLRLFKTAGDAPVIVFDHGKGFVEAGYDDGNDTVVGQSPVAKIPAGRYTIAQIPVTHSAFRVSSTMHASGMTLPGEFDCVETLSDDVTLGGTPHAMGWYRYVFETGGEKYPQEGSGALLPSSPTTGGFTMKTVGGETFYEVPIDLVMDPTVTTDVHVVMDVNMDRSFRWEDQGAAGYATGVYDTTPTSYEPIRRFGANSFVVRFEVPR
ncbi:MAG: hypothetical protein ABI175_01910 [Polyangiales bacterium]